MKMLSHYFISDNLDDLEVFEEQLENAGVSNPQIHVLSRNDTDVARHHHLHDVKSFMKKDIVHSTTLGAVIGIFASALVLSVAYFSGWTETAAGWIPFIFLAVIMLGFCTWEGGLLGIQKPNHHFRRVEKALSDGKHIFFVDLEALPGSGIGEAAKIPPAIAAGRNRDIHPTLVYRVAKKIPRFFKETWP